MTLFFILGGIGVAIVAGVVGLATSPSHDSKLAGRCSAVMWAGATVAASAGLIKLAEVLL